MNRLAKIMTCAATVAMVSVPTVASAQYRSYHRDRDNIDAGDIIAGVAVIGGVAAIASALSRDGGRYGYNYGYRYRDNYVSAVNACARYADRYGGGVRILDVDRRSSNRYRVRGVVEGGYGGGYGGYGDRYGRSGYGGGYGGNNGYNGYNYGAGYGRSFACTATEYGRITDFDVNGRDRY